MVVRVRSATAATVIAAAIAGYGGVEEQNMAKSLTRSPFSVPSQAVLSNKIAWLSEARYFYETKLRELEHQFEAKVAELREEYFGVILQIHESPEQLELGRARERNG